MSLAEFIGLGLYFLIGGGLAFLLLREEDRGIQEWAIAFMIGLAWPLVIITKLWDKFLDW